MPAYELVAIVNPPVGSHKKKVTAIALPPQVQEVLTQVQSLLRDQRRHAFTLLSIGAQVVHSSSACAFISMLMHVCRWNAPYDGGAGVRAALRVLVDVLD